MLYITVFITVTGMNLGQCSFCVCLTLLSPSLNIQYQWNPMCGKRPLPASSCISPLLCDGPSSCPLLSQQAVQLATLPECSSKHWTWHCTFRCLCFHGKDIKKLTYIHRCADPACTRGSSHPALPWLSLPHPQSSGFISEEYMFPWGHGGFPQNNLD